MITRQMAQRWVKLGEEEQTIKDHRSYLELWMSKDCPVQLGDSIGGGKVNKITVHEVRDDFIVFSVNIKVGLKRDRKFYRVKIGTAPCQRMGCNQTGIYFGNMILCPEHKDEYIREQEVKHGTSI